MKIVSQLDADGLFVGPVKAHASPLQPGAYNVPRGAVDVPPPEVPPGQRARWVEGAWLFEPLPAQPPLPPWVPPTPEQLQADALRQIDADVDALYRDVIGYRATEYEVAEREAQAFQAGGFVGDVPPSVASWVAASGMPPEAAALDILQEAQVWRDAAQQIRAQRLLAKAGVRAGTVTESMAAWSGFLQTMRLALGV